MPKSRSQKPTAKVTDNVGARGRVPRAVKPASSTPGVPIVGIGASAGGLEAFSKLLGQLPSDSGLAFVLIQHLDPTRASLLVEALGRATKMPVIQAKAGARVEPNRVYVIPPNADVGIEGGRLSLEVRGVRGRNGRASHLPVDSFFRALAKDRGSRAIGVVLSGTGSDGTDGLRAIKAADGITLAQDPRSAKFSGMPRSAIDAGVVDRCLSIAKLADELVRLGRHPYVLAGEVDPPAGNQATLNQIFRVVKEAVGVDFAEYKSPTVERRIARRMALARAEDLPAYLQRLEGDQAEALALYEDILIHVTAFFRDPEVFERLKTHVFPKILANKAAGVPIRIWVAGCSTGEEVYSLAIVLLEFLQDAPGARPIQIFGTDVSDKAIERARGGVFPDSAVRDIAPERRQRYFTKVDGGYRINKVVRDLCVFVRHDLARDPPFSKLDLASCRNVLIYFDQALQKRVIPTLHYCLNQPGYLLLGRSEAISGFTRLFSPLDKTYKIFSRTAVPSLLHFAPRADLTPVAATGPPSRAPEQRPGGVAVDVAKHLDRVMLARYAPPGVLVTEKLDILQFRGQTGDYLQPAPGEPQSNLIKMARPGLLAPLRAALAQARKEMAPVRKPAEIDHDGTSRRCDVVVVPFTALPQGNERNFLVIFEEPAAPAPKPLPSPSATSGRPGKRGARAGQRQAPLAPHDARRLPKLQHELGATKDYLQSLIEEHGKTTDALGSANEELVSGNEELQSLNEELETAKEELQSTNEELTTVNDELQSRNQEVTLVNSDLMNLLSTVDIPILILDRERRIRRFTPKARSILNVVAGDVGRPFDDIRPNLLMPDLDARIARVIKSMDGEESEVQDRAGTWYRLQLRPYRSPEGRVEGAILSLLDIDALKHHIALAERATAQAERATAQAERANRAKDEFLATLSHELRTPLTTMLLQSQRIKRGLLQGEPLTRAGAAIERGTQMQVQLIDHLLDVSRIVSGKMEVMQEAVDFVEVVRAAIDVVAASAELKPITLTIALDEALDPVWGNATRLQQVVTNLLTNAIKFTPKGGEVKIVLGSSEGQALLEVSDNGRGIDPAFLPRVFRRFSQEDSSVTRTYGGLGLGLAIAHHLVELHGGTIRAESAGLDQGASFFVSLPLAPVAEAKAEAAVARRRPPGSPDGAIDVRPLIDLRILIVDDDLGAREAVAEMLTGTGARVMVADSAAAGLAAIQDFHPGVVLCDVAMPFEDGYSFIRQVRALDSGRGGAVPALALTALAGEDDRRRALDAGFQMHVTKPVDIDRLTQAVVDLSHAAVVAHASPVPVPRA